MSGPADAATPPLVEVRGVRKVFGAVTALAGVDLDIRAGEVHALLGPNGAGKSTLVKVLAGVHQPDGGRVVLAGEEVAFANPHDARDAGIAVVYQELSLIPTLSVADNIFLGRERQWFGLARGRDMRDEARRLCAELDLDVDVTTPVGRLPFAQRQLVEIVKALSIDARVFVLDEPTSSLTPSEEAPLYTAVNRLRDRGAAIIYITHRLREVFDLSDRVTIIRDARVVGTYDTANINMATLVAGIVGEREQAASVEATGKRPRPSGDRVAALTVRGLRNHKLRGVDLEVRPGEVIGIAGLRGSGRSSLLRAVFGIDPVEKGDVLVDGGRVRSQSPADAMRAGIALVPEDRALQGLVVEQAISANICLTKLHDFATRGLISDQRMRVAARRSMSDLAIKASSERAPVRTLSGGNQQKVVFAKWMQTKPRVFLLDEPMAGIDVGAKRELGLVMRDLAAAGAAVVVVSSELEDLLDVCDSIAVFSHGRVVEQFPRDRVKSEDELHSLVQVWEAGEDHGKD